jgi:hypothetical protein
VTHLDPSRSSRFRFLHKSASSIHVDSPMTLVRNCANRIVRPDRPNRSPPVNPGRHSSAPTNDVHVLLPAGSDWGKSNALKSPKAGLPARASFAALYPRERDLVRIAKLGEPHPSRHHNRSKNSKALQLRSFACSVLLRPFTVNTPFLRSEFRPASGGRISFRILLYSGVGAKRCPRAGERTSPHESRHIG